ncbi:hypothetical protein F5884DRAFT_527266 [Xylogone sp. PMI_703]|nr:hypothetical protein F5884DRAFT_527266 [Xylogone sp. PMI_703]
MAVVPPAQLITATDKAGLIVVITTFFLSCIWLALCVRLYVRVRVNGPWKLDDYCVAAATVLSTIRSILVYVGVNKGYGKSATLLHGDDFVRIGRIIFGDTILFFLALMVSKWSIVLLCMRLSPAKAHSRVLWGTFIAAAAWALASILLISINCNSSHALTNLAGTCPSLAARWKVSVALDMITEAALFGCCMYLVVGLKMSWSLKTVVVVAFSIRLPTIIFAGLRLDAVDNQVASSDPTLLGAYTASWMQIELDYSIMAATLSCLGAFLKPFSQEMGPSRSDTQRSYQLSNMSNSAAARSRRRGSRPDMPVLRKDAMLSNTATVSHTNKSADDTQSLESNDSRKGIIMKQVQWTVERDSSIANTDPMGSRTPPI